MNESRITPLTESGLMTALLVVLAMAALYLPVFGMFAAMLWPIPLVVLTTRQGMRWGVMVAFGAMVLMASLLEPVTALQLVLALAPGAIALGVGFARKWPAGRTFLTAAGVSILAKITTFAVLFLITSVNPLTMEVNALNQSYDASFAMYESMGMDEEILAESREQSKFVIQMMMTLLPLIVVLMGLLDTAISYLVGTRVLRRLGHSVPEVPPYAEWRLPSVFLFIFGFSLLAIYWGDSRQWQILYQAGMNFCVFSMIAGFIQGTAILTALFDRHQVRRLWRVVLFILIFLNGLFLQIVAVMGLFDMVFDYRKRLADRDKRAR